MNWQADISNAKHLLAGLSPDSSDASLRVVVLAAHPDDETIGASAVLARYPQTQVVYLTDGAPRNTKLWPPKMSGSRQEYAALRLQEAACALAHAGIAAEQIFWLGGVDQEAICEANALVSRLSEFLREFVPDVLITHPYEGGHPDHDCAALIAQLAPACLGREAPEVVEMTSYHARRGRCVTGEFLPAQPSPEIEFHFSEGDRERKRKMMDEYKSQRLVLENFPISSERLRIAPAYDFSQPAHEGTLWYECMGWEMTGARWRELAAKVLSQSKECPWA